MKSRRDFNVGLLSLLNQMTADGEEWLLDYLKRSDQEQERMFAAKLSKCDGKINISWHQFGRAVDIYFLDRGSLVDPKKGWDHWHQVWLGLGGHPMLEFDKGHFEG